MIIGFRFFVKVRKITAVEMLGPHVEAIIAGRGNNVDAVFEQIQRFLQIEGGIVIVKSRSIGC